MPLPSYLLKRNLWYQIKATEIKKKKKNILLRCLLKFFDIFLVIRMNQFGHLFTFAVYSEGDKNNLGEGQKASVSKYRRS